MAFPNDSSRITRDIGAASAAAPDYTSASVVAARSLVRKTFLVAVAAVAANGAPANANVSPSVFFKNPARILGVTVMPQGNSTANIFSYQTLAIKPVSALGVTGNTIANISTQTVASGGTGNINQSQPFSLTVQTGNNSNRVAANTWVGVDIQPTSVGIGLSAATWAIDFEEEGPDLYKV